LGHDECSIKPNQQILNGFLDNFHPQTSIKTQHQCQLLLLLLLYISKSSSVLVLDNEEIKSDENLVGQSKMCMLCLS
jgi:hypothetical protein